ncbi:hypothetical protein E4T56_gene7665 [Termitomyces sp. T112]|nr:hypothetical protein E4T56_gene7665 [Termitomyces sp. T112]
MVNDLTFSQLQITDITVELPVSSSKSIQSIDIAIDDENVSGQVRGQALAGASRTLIVALDRPRRCRFGVSTIDGSSTLQKYLGGKVEE